jgi:DNA repair exonuclease SbcCD nuclease subunit
LHLPSNENGDSQESSQRKSLVLLHTSDIHLTTIEDKGGAWAGFKHTLEVADSVQADAMLIVGDFFDTPRTDPVVISQAFEMLGKQPRPTIILPGNHDGDVMSRNGHNQNMPDNIYLFQETEGQIIRIPSLGLSAWGKPVYDHSPEFHPLQGAQPRNTLTPNDWYIVMAHGFAVQSADDAFASSTIQPEEIAQVDCDYIALGHVHVYRDVTTGSTPAIYSGAPSGPYETTVAIVNLQPGSGVTAKPFVLAPSHWGR